MSYEFLHNLLKDDLSLKQYPRTLGYMGEILFGIYQYYLLSQKCSMKETPLVLFENTQKDVSLFNIFNFHFTYYARIFILTYFPKVMQRYLKVIYHKIK